MLQALRAEGLATTLAAGNSEVLRWPIGDDDIRKYGWTDQQVSNLRSEGDIAAVLGTPGAPPACIRTGELETFDAALTAEIHVLRQRMADTYDEDEFYGIWQQLWKLDDVQRSITGPDPAQKARDTRCRTNGRHSSAPTEDRPHLREERVLGHEAATAKAP